MHASDAYYEIRINIVYRYLAVQFRIPETRLKEKFAYMPFAEDKFVQVEINDASISFLCNTLHVIMSLLVLL